MASTIRGSDNFDTGINGKMVSMTAQNSTSGTSIDFTGIPSWAKRITIMFNGVSTSTGSSPCIQVGGSVGIEAQEAKTVEVMNKIDEFNFNVNFTADERGYESLYVGLMAKYGGEEV